MQQSPERHARDHLIGWSRHLDEGGPVRRREFITIIGGAVAGWPLAARAQQPTGKAARIGYLSFRSPASTDEAFLQGLRELGWIEGQNIFIERRYASVAFAAYWMNSDMLAAGKCGGFGKDATT